MMAIPEVRLGSNIELPHEVLNARYHSPNTDNIRAGC